MFNRHHFIAPGLALIGLCGCQTAPLPLTAEQEQIRKDLAPIKPAESPLARNTGIVDIHTHTFNARYLPLDGILLGKRDAAPPLTWLISDHCAGVLAQLLIDRTELSPVGDQKGIASRTDSGQEGETREAGLVCGIVAHLLDRAASKGAWNKSLPPEKRREAVDDIASHMSPTEQMAIRTAARMMGMDDHLKYPDQTKATVGAVRFLWMLTQADAGMTELFRRDYAKVPMRGSPLLVSHMMDLAPVYDQKPQGKTLLDFATDQIPRMQEFENRPDSSMIYFVAYNPYRDHWNGGLAGDALKIVRSAIENQGAWGVKVYPPSGYRPAGNAIKPRPRTFFTDAPGREWDARYADLGSNPNAQLDHRLDELLTWCIANDVPVLVHCGTGEFEARKCYGVYHSNPRYWRQFLESHSSPGAPCRLRLCLGHAGSADFWFGGTAHPEWGQEVYDLCREFPNVYCEITTHSELAATKDQTRRAYFVDRVARCFDEPTSKCFPYPFSKKLMYGTDWYLPDAEDRAQILLGTETAFLHPRLRSHYRDYFFNNAMAFLNVRSRLHENKFPVRSVVRSRLEQALQIEAASDAD